MFRNEYGSKKIFIANDHGGFLLKNHLVKKYPKIQWEDLGTHSEESVDYPDFADKMAQKIAQNPSSIGVLICGSGQGMALRANKYPHLRAALCWNSLVAKLAREHNNANVLCLGARVMGVSTCESIFESFLNGQFAGGRHENRVKKIKEPLKC